MNGKQLKQYRLRTIKAIAQKIADTDKKIKQYDYKLDTLAREILSLPLRPANTLPYVGWLAPASLTIPNQPGKISQRGINLIKRWEGFRSKAYLCPANVWTIGYGHTATAKPGMCVSETEAEDLLKKDLARFENSVSRLVTVDLTQNQFDALVSFTFNVGTGALAKSTLLRKLNNKDYNDAASELDRWVNPNTI